jgi:hypothetical protein
VEEPAGLGHVERRGHRCLLCSGGGGGGAGVGVGVGCVGVGGGEERRDELS